MTVNDPAAIVLRTDQLSDYMPQLNTLRTFAVFLVVVSHWTPEDHWLRFIPYGINLPYGIIGVILFFVLSGFLITRILLKSRINFEEKKLNRFHSIKQFYIRRTLRIFPVYYVTLLVLFIFNIRDIREKILWFVFYVSNYYFMKIDRFEGVLSHLWTLSIEEQFYLIWPFIILFIPTKYLLKTIIAFIVIGPLSRFIILALTTSVGISNFQLMLTTASMDSFGLGALLAYQSIYKISDELKMKAFRIFTLLYISLMTALYICNYSHGYLLLLNFNLSLLSFFIIAKTSKGFKGVWKKIFENRVLVYLGQISYGLYLFHPFVSFAYKRLPLPPIENALLKFMVYSLILIAVSSVSWFILEKPINNLKKHFSYNT